MHETRAAYTWPKKDFRASRTCQIRHSKRGTRAATSAHPFIEGFGPGSLYNPSKAVKNSLYWNCSAPDLYKTGFTSIFRKTDRIPREIPYEILIIFSFTKSFIHTSPANNTYNSASCPLDLPREHSTRYIGPPRTIIYLEL